MNIEVVYVMLTLTCSGHTNAKCIPTIQYFNTQTECEKARIIPGGPSLFPNVLGAGNVPDQIDENTVCFPTIKELD